LNHFLLDQIHVTFFVLKFILFISFGGEKTRKKVEFFPPLGGIKRGYPWRAGSC